MIEHINQFAQWWWTWSMNMFWQVGLLIVLVAFIDAVIRKWAWPQVRYALWLMILVKLILPPGTHLPGSVTSRIQPWVVETLSRITTQQNTEGVASSPDTPTLSYVVYADPTSVRTGPAALAEAVAPSALMGNDTSNSLPVASVAKPLWQAYAMGAWLIGIAVLGVWLLSKLHRLRQGIPDTMRKAVLPESFDTLVERCARKIGLKHTPQVVVTNGVVCPAVTGVFRPILLMPIGFLSRLSRKDTEHMLLHEFAHIRRGDLWIHSLYLVLQIVYWYNPLLWLVNRQMHHLREVCCDATVANRLRDKTLEYRETLLDVARRYLAHPAEPGLGLLGLFEDSNHLAVRLAWLQKKTWRYARLRRAIIIFVITTMSLYVLPMAQAQPQISEHTDLHHETASKDIAPEDEPLQALEEQMQQLAEQMNELEKNRMQLQMQMEQLRAQKMQEQVQHDQESSNDPLSRAERWQQWAKQMELWGEQIDAWVNSPEVQNKIKEASRLWDENFSKKIEAWQDSNEYKEWQKDLNVWEKDVEKWAEDLVDSGRAVWEHIRDQEPNEIPSMPPMPPMPPLPVMPKNYPQFNLELPTTPKAKHAPMPNPQPHVVVPKVKPDHKDKNTISMPSCGVQGGTLTQSIHEKHQGDKCLVKRLDSIIMDLSSGTTLDLVNEDGCINITGSDNEQCMIQAHVHVSAPTPDEAQALSNQVGFITSNDNNVLAIRATDLKDLPANHSYSTSYNIVLPRNTQLKLANEDGDINIANISGNISIKLEDGDVDVSYADTVPDDCKVDIRIDDGEITFSAPSAMFPDDLTHAKKQSEDGQRWSTQRKTDTGVREVNLSVEDGEITVDQQ